MNLCKSADIIIERKEFLKMKLIISSRSGKNKFFLRIIFSNSIATLCTKGIFENFGLSKVLEEMSWF